LLHDRSHLINAVAYAVVHNDPPSVYLASDIEVLHCVLAFEVVARTNPGRMDEGRCASMRQALLDERWGDAVVEWMSLTNTAIDVYTHLPIYTESDLPDDLIGAQLQFTRLFRT
jgi:hypothetical protein